MSHFLRGGGVGAASWQIWARVCNYIDTEKGGWKLTKGGDGRGGGSSWEPIYND